MEEKNKLETKIGKNSIIIVRYIAAIILFTFFIFFFSIMMASIASFRNDITDNNYDNTARVYNGPLLQNSPSLNEIDITTDFYKQKNITIESAKRYTDNTFLTATNGKVMINAEFVKKGLTYQPTYKTEFNAEYTLKNTLDEESYIKFEFPFPINADTNEISNAKLVVNGEEIKNAKTSFPSSLYNYTKDFYEPQTVNGMLWEGKIGPRSETKVQISYNTVGISLYKYEGIENSKGSQDFNFQVEINGTRSYDISEGLSVDKRNFEKGKVILEWNKPDLYNKPLVSVSVGDKLNPSVQVSRIYITMAPIYLIFSSIVIFLTYKFGRRIIGIFDLFLLTILFGVYFPLIHYLSSFTIDPTVDIFSNINVAQFSMPLYLAFGLSFASMGSLIFYLISRISGFKFSLKFITPTLILFLGFFPLVVTIPEYSMLLVIIGTIALIAIIIQVRIKLMNQE